jgi:hypothetical protein
MEAGRHDIRVVQAGDACVAASGMVPFFDEDITIQFLMVDTLTPWPVRSHANYLEAW